MNQVGASKVFLIRCYENQVDENEVLGKLNQVGGSKVGKVLSLDATKRCLHSSSPYSFHFYVFKSINSIGYDIGANDRYNIP